MKKELLLISLLLTTFFIFSTFIYSQNIDELCAFDIDNSLDSFTNSRYIQMDFETETPQVFNVLFHIVQSDSGENIHNIQEENLLEAIARLNLAFNQFNIFFKYRGFENINNTYFLDCSSSEVRDEFKSYIIDDYENNFLENINVYITNIQSSAIYTLSIAFIDNDHIDTESSDSEMIVHEMGHIFNLLHTFNGTYNSNIFTNNISNCFIGVDDQMYIPLLYSTAENVTRDPNSTDFNALTNGDKVADTHAIFKNVSYNCYPDSNDPQHSIFCPNPEVVDNTGEIYDLITDYDLYNYMNYFNNVRYFTAGQGVRMRDALLETDKNRLYQKLTNVQSLYEPYKGIYFTSGNYNEYINNPPKFQFGFDYVFVECGDGTNEMYESPTPYGDTFTYTSTIIHLHQKTDFKSVDHPNHSAIKLIQVDANQPHKCWNNWNKSASSGSITKFNDGIINSNITVYPKDSLQINDIYLIHNLNNGLYKIEKQYDDGSQEQNIIIKDNE